MAMRDCSLAIAGASATVLAVDRRDLAVGALGGDLGPGGLVGQADDRDDLLALLHLEQHHALGAAAGDADVVDRAADELAAVGDQHDLVAVAHREGGDDLAVALGHLDAGDAGAAAAGDAVLVGRAALAEAV